MASTFPSSPPIAASHIPLLTFPRPNSLLTFFSPFPTKRRRKSRKITVKHSHKPTKDTHLMSCNFGPRKTFVEAPRGKKSRTEEGNSVASTVNVVEFKSNVFSYIARPIAFALFCIAIGFCPIGKLPVRAIAAPAAAEVAVSERGRGRGKNSKELNSKGHEYSDFTEQLLEKVSDLLRRIEDAKTGNGDVVDVEKALKEVKLKKEQLKGEIMSGLYAELRELRREKAELVKRSEVIIDAVVKAKNEEERSLRKGGGGDEVRERMSKLEESVNGSEKEYNEIWEKIGEIEDRILWRESMALNIGVRELNVIERESEQLVRGFRQEMRQQGIKSVPKNFSAKLSRSDIQKELETAQRKHWQQIILPSVLEVADLGPSFDPDSRDFVMRIRQALKDSGKMQKNLEALIRKNRKRSGEEKHFVVRTPVDEFMKGFPEAELKWMFGKKEVVIPNSVGLHLFHGWKKWRQEAKAGLKRNMLENSDLGKESVVQRQERVILDRDRVVFNTRYNVERNRWEMDPIAVPYAVSKKLIENARIRHDWGAMYIVLKGDDKEYFVDVKEFEMLFEDFGGFHGLYLRMVASGIPAAVELMWIPFSELDFQQQFLLIMRLSHQCLNGLWKTKIVSYARQWVFEKIKNINDDIMMMIVFPIVDSIIPFPMRMQLGMAWPEEKGQIVDSTWYLKWQSEAETSFKSRKTDDINWFLWFLIRSIIYGYVLFHVFQFMKRRIPRILGYGPLRRDPNRQKLQRVKYYFKYRAKRIKGKKEAGIDPIRTAFDNMKRVKNPPIRLKDFASIESMREEINEVVAFLQNPRAFQEMGARAPRGVLIVGERGTGKTSLALAIAAEAKVPVVEVKAQQLEAGLWVGQSASNVRELFQTARDLAPVIIFVEDFDLFAGVRGKFIHTKKQDHEAFINQLLVELDGFEKQDGVVLMATTRSLKQIDQALQRPGRMDRIFHLQRPTDAEREKILRISAEETMDDQLIDFVDWRKVAEKTALLRPIELKLVPVALEGCAFRSKFLDTDELMSYCSWFATLSRFVPKWIRKTKIMKKISKTLVNHLGLTLTKGDLQNVVELMEPYGQISNGMELLSPPVDWTRETKFPHAVWAAGRGLIALLLPNFDAVDNLWLEPLSWEGIGCTKITKAKNEGSMNGNLESKSYLEKKLVFCFGSYVAAQLLLPFGEENFLSSSELKQAQEIATRMVIQYGWGPDDNPTIYYHSNAVTALSMGDNHEYEMAAKVEKLYHLAYDKAKEMLQKNHRVLENIVDALLEFEILTGKDLERMVEVNGGTREKEPFFLSKVNDKEPVSSTFLENENAWGTTFLGTTA
ncbi:probable inactive ATP-dependent zinc metalloprotease FTSHI 5, chloroplastic [Malania oleifera]|uniref:probable inactive ATP-dependent zinc metalloprotease FTSHI 5, chloroplastic n=1 Tax=Malania oleifera TaxID=397392 RepID=UPI0025AE99E0|nr:probable inactive ATP-dependent zinc metalloprotease FTSHI 5, chloroplastic [Malania oleifera]